MPTFTVKKDERLKHDGKEYEGGDEVELSLAEAKKIRWVFEDVIKEKKTPPAATGG